MSLQTESLRGLIGPIMMSEVMDSSNDANDPFDTSASEYSNSQDVIDGKEKFDYSNNNDSNFVNSEADTGSNSCEQNLEPQSGNEAEEEEGDEDEDDGLIPVSDQLLDDLCIDESDQSNQSFSDQLSLNSVVEKPQSDRYFSFQLSSSNIVKKTNRKSFKCDICSVNYRHMYSLKRHYLKTHINRRYISEQDLIHCCINTKSEADPQKAPDDDSTTGIYKCNLCSTFFDTSGELCLHLKEHPMAISQEDSFRCQHCNMVFSMKRYLQRHMTVHLGNRKVRRKTTMTPNGSISQPMESIKYTCSQCSQTFSNSEKLKLHIDTHDKQVFVEADKEKSLAIGLGKPGFKYGCTMCNKLFSNYINMCRHRRLAHQVSQRLNGRIRSFHSPIYHRNQADYAKTSDVEPRDNIDDEYYERLSQSIEENLTKFVDGKLPASQNCEVIVDEEATARPENEQFIQSCQKIIDLARHLLAESEMQECDCNVNVLDDTSLFVCFTCYNVYFDRNELNEHKLLDHPTIVTSHLEMIGEMECPVEIRQNNIDAVGILSNVAETPLTEDLAIACTKCSVTCNSIEALHSHILECGEDKSLANVVSSSIKRIRRRQKGMKRHFVEDVIPFKKPFSIEPTEDKTKLLTKNIASIKDVSKSAPGSPTGEELPPNMLPSQELRCEGCYMKFDYIAALDRHQRACTMARRLNGIKSSARGLYSRHNPTSSKRRCQHCLRSFSYLASLRKHMEEGCIQQDLSQLQKKAVVKKEKIVQKKKEMVSQSQTMVAQGSMNLPITFIAIEPLIGNPTAAEVPIISQSKETKNCNNCNKSFTCVEDFDKHVATQCSDASNSKVEESDRNEIQETVAELISTQTEQNKVLGDAEHRPGQSKLQTFPCKICHTIYFSYVKLLKHRLSHKLEASESKQTQLEIEKQTKTDEAGGQIEIKYLEKDCTCPICKRIFASPLNMGRHKRMAHGIIREALNQRRVILSQQTKEEKALGQKFRVSVSKVEKDGKEETQFVIQPKDAAAANAAKETKKRGRKPSIKSAESEAGDASQTTPKKRGWPKGKKRKLSTDKAEMSDATYVMVAVEPESGDGLVSEETSEIS